MSRYKVMLPLVVHTEDGSYEQFEEFEKEFSEEDEATNLDSGLLEIVPRDYRVIGGSNVLGANPGETLTAAIRIGQERLLTEGGHIERVEPEPVKKTTTKKKED